MNIYEACADMGGPSFVVAAQPGWAVLEPIWYGDNNSRVECFTYEPVIAWRIVIDAVDLMGSDAYAVTAESGVYGDGVIRRPDGSLFVPGVCSIENEDAAKRWFEKRDHERRQI